MYSSGNMLRTNLMVSDDLPTAANPNTITLNYTSLASDLVLVLVPYYSKSSIIIYQLSVLVVCI